MKKNPYLCVLLIIIIVLGVEFGIIQGCLKTTRLYPRTEIVLKLKTENLDENDLPQKISEDSIAELQKVLKDTSLNKNQDELIEVFDKERNFYINFITLISIVLSIIGIAPVVYGIFEKNENIKLREELENLKKEYDLELGKLKLIDFFNKIQRRCSSFKRGTRILLEKKREVKNLNEFERFNISRLDKELKEIDVSLLCDDNMTTFATQIYNLLNSILIYQGKHFNIFPKNEIEQIIVADWPILKNIFIPIRSNLLPNQFEELIQSIIDLPGCKYDFTDL